MACCRSPPAGTTANCSRAAGGYTLPASAVRPNAATSVQILRLNILTVRERSGGAADRCRQSDEGGTDEHHRDLIAQLNRRDVDALDGDGGRPYGLIVGGVRDRQGGHDGQQPGDDSE